MTPSLFPELPLFPLRTVLFPGGMLELKIFEARYLDLISRCLRESAPFGVVLLRTGGEAKGSAEPVVLHDSGTLAELIEVDSAQAGILEIRARGTRRFTLENPTQRPDGLWIGRASMLPEEVEVAPGPSHRNVVQSLSDAIGALERHGARPFPRPHRLDSAGWVANRWCEILPLPLEAKQRLLVLEDPVARLDVVDSLLRDKSATH